MPDTRVVHTHHPAAVLYGEHGPMGVGGPSPRPLSTKMAWKAPVQPPESIQAHIEQAIGKIKDLSPAQRNSVRAAMLEMTRDLSFIRHIMDQMPRAPTDEGGVL